MAVAKPKRSKEHLAHLLLAHFHQVFVSAPLGEPSDVQVGGAELIPQLCLAPRLLGDVPL